MLRKANLFSLTELSLKGTINRVFSYTISFSFGDDISKSGEVVFNTGMVGYPESLTDPSYRGQILVFTFPMMGNYGVPGDELDEYGLPKYFESDQIHVSGVIVADYSFDHSHWAAKKSLSEWLKVSCVRIFSTPQSGSRSF